MYLGYFCMWVWSVGFIYLLGHVCQYIEELMLLISKKEAEKGQFFTTSLTLDAFPKDSVA